MQKKHYINNLYNCIYLQLVYSTYICYYNYTIKKAVALLPRTNRRQSKKKGSYYYSKGKKL